LTCAKQPIAPRAIVTREIAPNGMPITSRVIDSDDAEI
jgi:hypothetical protein